VDDMDDVRFTPRTGDDGSEVSMPPREDLWPDAEDPACKEPERCGSSVLEELALEVLMLASRAPCRERGGGGGDFATDIGSLLLDTGLARVSMVCCDDMVREELLRDLFPPVEVRS
jgi:hypothetical protein